MQSVKTLKVGFPITSKEESVFRHLVSVCNEIPLMAAKWPELPQFAEIPTPRVAGGWVRDKLLTYFHPELRIIPPKDIDIAFDTLTGAEFSKFLEVFDREHGTYVFRKGECRSESAAAVEVSLGNRLFGVDVEFIQLRKEEYNREGDRNSVSVNAGSLTEDAFRRDLTVNALFFNLMTREVEDCVGGLQDLINLVLRTPERPHSIEFLGSKWEQAKNLTAKEWTEFEVNRIFTEDPIRVLRVIRFYSRWPNSQIAEPVYRGMQDSRIQNLIVQKTHNHDLNKNVPGTPPEKLADELRKILKGQQPSQALRLMFDNGLLQQILRLPKNFSDFTESQQNRHHNLSFIDHTLKVVANLNEIAIENGISDTLRSLLLLCALFHDLGKMNPDFQQRKSATERSYHNHELESAHIWSQMARALRLSRYEAEFCYEVILAHMVPHRMVDTCNLEIKASDSDLRKFVSDYPRWQYILMHAEADSQAKGYSQCHPMVGKLYRRIRTEIIPSLSGIYLNPYRNPSHRLYDAKRADSEYILRDLSRQVTPGEVLKLVGLPAISQPIPNQGLPRRYIEWVYAQLRYRQINGWDPQEKEQIVEAITDMRGDVFRYYGPRISANLFRDLPEYAHLLKRPQYIPLVKKKIQDALLQNPNLTQEHQLAIARAAKEEVYEKFGHPPCV